MSLTRRLAAAAGLTASALVAAAIPAAAQTYYPSFQVPRVANRDFNFAAVDGVQYTALVFQWREGVTSSTQLSFDAGLGNPAIGNADASLLLGGQLAIQSRRSDEHLMLDMVITLGAYAHVADGANTMSFPAGVSAGYRIALPDGMAVTPFVHPRLAVNMCSTCAGDGGSSTNITPSVDIAASFEFTENLSARAGFLLGSSNARFGLRDLFGIALTWTPPTVSQPAR